MASISGDETFEAVSGPTAWTRDDVGGSSVWSADIASVGGAELAETLEALLFNGPAFALLRGVPVDGSGEQLRKTLLGLGALLGTPLPQDRHGTIIDAVRDEQSAGVRGAKTNRALPHHTDMAHVVPDVFALLTARQAGSGGESRLVSGHTVFNILARAGSPHIARLSANFDFDHSQDVAPDQSPVASAPVFRRAPGTVHVRYNRARIHRGHRITGRALDRADVAALDALDAILDAEENTLALTLEPGDVLFVNNSVVLHSRTAFVDQGGGPGRLLLRHWIRR
jgi:alpha-ketoglutarate-dependent taurine dioxygenase